MKRERLVSLLARFPHLRIAVLGDLFLDKWMLVDRRLDEPSVETGLAAYQVVKLRADAGAAGTVLNNLAALGVGSVYAVGFVGVDGDGWEVRRALAREGVDVRHVVRSLDRVTPAYLKPLFLSDSGAPRESNRLDILNRTPSSRTLEKKLISHLRAAATKADALIVLDQLSEENTGAVTSAVREEISRIARARPELVLFADSRAFISRFHDVTIKCNYLEAARMALGQAPEGFSKEAVFTALKKLHEQTGREAFVTCSEHGVACRSGGKNCLVPAARQPGPIDVCGAGDACTAGIVSSLCAGADPREAAFIGNLASGVTVRKIGVTGTASPGEILALYDEQFGGGAV